MCIIIEQGGSGRVIDDMCGYDAIQAVSHRQFAEARERSEASAFQHLHLFSLPFTPPMFTTASVSNATSHSHSCEASPAAKLQEPQAQGP